MRPALWEVDAQADFMLPGGKLYVPGAEKIAGNLNRLVESARQDRAFLVSSADAHSLSDPEFREWPPHCLKGTPGAELIPEARAARCQVIPNQKGFALPRDLATFQQVLLEKNTLDVFDNPNTDALLAQMSTAAGAGSASPLDFLLFGVVTEHCVRYATEGLLRRGHRVSIVTDAIQSLDEKKGKAVLDELQVRGARLITTKEALVMLGADSRASSR
jgi:nicotinamidase/pyrazinamidase